MSKVMAEEQCPGSLLHCFFFAVNLERETAH